MGNDVTNPLNGNSFPLLQIIGIFVVGFLSLVGSMTPPLLSKYFPNYNMAEKNYFRFFNGFAAGVVLAVGYIHALSDSFTSFSMVLTNNSLVDQYSWAGLIGMMGSLITFTFEELLIRNFKKKFQYLSHKQEDDELELSNDIEKNIKLDDKKESEKENDVEKNIKLDDKKESEKENDIEKNIKLDDKKESEKENDIEKSNNEKKKDEYNKINHEINKNEEKSMNEEKLIYYTELLVLLFGLSFHSIFVGLALGVANNDVTLFIAIVFHQLFEGFALGARLLRADFKKKSTIWIVDLSFILAAPIGIIIGIFIKQGIQNNPFVYGIVDGILEALSGGILIYVSLIHMMKEEIERPEFQKFNSLLLTLYSGFILGATAMAIIGIWA